MCANLSIPRTYKELFLYFHRHSMSFEEDLLITLFSRLLLRLIMSIGSLVNGRKMKKSVE